MNGFCPSVHVHGVVVLLAGGGYTKPLYAVIKLFVLKMVGSQKPSLKLPLHLLHPSHHALHHLHPSQPSHPLYSLHPSHPLHQPLHPSHPMQVLTSLCIHCTFLTNLHTISPSHQTSEGGIYFTYSSKMQNLGLSQ